MKITIAIPTFNQAAFIEKAVESALAQDYPQLEVIVADDASSDNTGDLLKKYAGDPRFRYRRNEENLGRTGNYKNILYQLATGEWYINLDGDDYLNDPAFISLAVKQIEKNNDHLVAVIANSLVLDEKNNSSVLYSSNYTDEQLVSGRQFLQDVAAQRAQTTHLSTLYNRQKAMETGFYHLDILSSDFESIYRLALQGDIVYLKTTAGTWRKHGANAVEQKSVREMIKNLSLPASVDDYAKSLAVNLGNWKSLMLKNMIAAYLLEAKKNGRLIKTFISCFFARPVATIKTISRLGKVLKHISTT